MLALRTSPSRVAREPAPPRCALVTSSLPLSSRRRPARPPCRARPAAEMRPTSTCRSLRASRAVERARVPGARSDKRSYTLRGAREISQASCIAFGTPLAPARPHALPFTSSLTRPSLRRATRTLSRALMHPCPTRQVLSRKPLPVRTLTYQTTQRCDAADQDAHVSTCTPLTPPSEPWVWPYHSTRAHTGCSDLWVG
jgi:hypothetical protein